MILLEKPKSEEEIDEAKKLGAKWSKKDGKWIFYIPDNTDWHSFAQWIPKDKRDELEKLEEITEPTFDELFDDISGKISVPPFSYKVEADVHSVFESIGHLILDLIDEHNIRRVLRVIFNNSAQAPVTEELENKRVEVEGELDLYRPSAQIQLKAKSIRVLGDCSRLAAISEWEKSCTNILRSVEEDEDPNEVTKRRNQVFEFTDIGLIATQNSKGHTDFMNKLYVIPPEQVHLKSDKMTVDNMVKAIREFNEEKACQCICIVRGGGDPEELIVFSDPELLRAIKGSDIPVITGIAHTADKLLCDRVSYYNANTPTGAADHLNFIWNKLHKKSKNNNISVINTKKQHEHDINYWIKKCVKQENIIRDNEAKIYELEQELEVLKKKNTGGFLSRILNW